MNARTRVGRNLRRLRVAAGVSQEMLAVDAKVEMAHVSRIENGLANPTVDMLERIAGALDIEISELFITASASKTPLSNLKRGRKRVR